MKSTNNPQTTEDMNQKAIALTEQDCIIEELSDEAQAAVSGGYLDRSPKPGTDNLSSTYDGAFWASLIIGG
jgi:hypothetical protein